MDWITDKIAIGSNADAHNATLRETAGFRAVVSLDGSMTGPKALALGYDDWATDTLIDGPGNDPANFRRLVKALIAMVDDSPPVLVHCHAGRSRSATLVAAYLVVRHAMSIAAAYQLIGNKREISVAPGLEALIRTCQG